MLISRTPWPQRRELLRKYKIRYFMPGATPTGWALGHIRRQWTDGQTIILLLDTE